MSVPSQLKSSFINSFFFKLVRLIFCRSVPSGNTVDLTLPNIGHARVTVTKILYGDRCYDFNYWERLVRWSDGTSGQAVDILRGQDREEAEYILKHLELHEQRLEELRKKIKKESKTDENMKRLQGIAGVGPIVAYAFVAHVGD